MIHKPEDLPHEARTALTASPKTEYLIECVPMPPEKKVGRRENPQQLKAVDKAARAFVNSEHTTAYAAAKFHLLDHSNSIFPENRINDFAKRIRIRAKELRSE
ncbi:hypothetical protein [Variovorax sp. dw_308]|uniref:hypothetical protein n=1 Tax=Variovorax sp. dw_308 TaxID=2721546 RepID=UPI001C47FD9D|nr:hypothetical protein [Variovorax sp. dw_308]